MRGWRRHDFYEATGLLGFITVSQQPPWTRRLSTPACAWLRAPMFRGRGTTRLSRSSARPSSTGFRLAERLAATGSRRALSSALFRPTFSQVRRSGLWRIQVHVTDRAVFRALSLRRRHSCANCTRWAASPFAGGANLRIRVRPAGHRSSHRQRCPSHRPSKVACSLGRAGGDLVAGPALLRGAPPFLLAVFVGPSLRSWFLSPVVPLGEDLR